jgi:hypothetical protein
VKIHKQIAAEKINQQQRQIPGEYLDSMLAQSALGAALEDPDNSMEAGQDGEPGPEVWKLLPHLQGISEVVLRRLPLMAMFHLNAALAKDKKHAGKLSINAGLAKNSEDLVLNPARINSGLDDRKNTLHEARFLGGASCSNAALWIQGRAVLGAQGATALGNYDLDSVGCGGSVTPKGWRELHNPASQELKLKMFYLPNVASCGLSARKVNLEDGEESLSIGDNLKDIADLEGFKGALNTLREAMHSALPFNRSIGAIVGFLTNTSYLQSDLGSSMKRVAILNEFVDHVLGRNALNWENNVPFLSTDDLAHVWTVWKGKRGALFQAQDKSEKRKDKPKQKKEPGNICRRFNAETCPSQADKECVSPTGIKLRHVCNKFKQGGGMCEKDHSRKAHV